MVEDESGNNVLLQKRSLNNQLYPGRWDNSAAGHVDDGEDYLTAAKRELFEEIGIKTDDLVEVGKYYNSTKAGDFTLNQFNKVYKFVTKDTPCKLQKKEVSEVKWFSIIELKKLVKESPELCTNGVIEVVERFY
jgi:isopentenyldiphosphate isomerase